MATPALNIGGGVSITKGKVLTPAFIVAYGPDGAGKSSFAAEAPSPIFVGPESGSNDLEVSRANGITTWEKVRETTTWLKTQNHDFKTFVGDSLDWMEPHLHKAVLGMDKNNPLTIEDSHNGYGRGFTVANKLWREWIDDLFWLRDNKKMNIILIAHSQQKAVNDPTELLPYDRYMLKLNDKASAIFREAADCVLFFNFYNLVRQDANNKKKAKAVGKEDRRFIYTRRTSAFDAKNRYGLPAEFEYTMGAGWQQFVEYRKAGNPDSLEMVNNEIAALIPLVPEEKRKDMTDAVAKANNELAQLIRIRDYARTLAGED